MTAHTHDDAFHEIQLNGKQLAFLFMAATIVSVVIFLCGVLVGRGVRTERLAFAQTEALSQSPSADLIAAAPVAAAPPAASDPTAAAPPPTVDDLSYPARLEQGRQPTEDLKPIPSNTSEAEHTIAPEKPASSSRAAAAAARATPPAPAAPVVTTAAAPAAASTTTPAGSEDGAAPAPGSGYAVQVAALNVRSEADAIAKRLSSKGYTAYVQVPAGGIGIGLPRQGGYVQDASRGGDRRRQTPEGRAVQALGYALNTSRSLSFTLAALSGVLLVLSFPKIGHPAVAWLALTPLLVGVYRQSVSRGFALGLTTGLIYFAGTIYWTSLVMAAFGGLNMVVAMGVTGALVAYLALFVAVFGMVMARLTVRAGSSMLLAAPVVWVSTELGRTYAFTGFPWVLLGYSQVTVLPIAQLASLVGVYGLSALCAAVSAAAAVVAVSPPAAREQRYRPLMAALGAVLVVAAWGAWRLRSADLTRSGEAVRVGLIQGNVDQAEKWDDRRASQIFRDYLQMTRQAISQGAEVVLWPESSTPFYFGEDTVSADQVRQMARQSHVPILLGSDQIERGQPPKYFNSAFLVGPDGRDAAVYRKLHLVPFGEYVPLKRVFFFAGRLVEAVSDFSPGEAGVLLPVKGHLMTTAICYEVVFPGLVRRFVAGGSELLSTITNDAWFGATAAPYQHFAQASMRAIENGRYLVRAANTGISGIVDPYGRVLQASRIFEPAIIVGEARFLREQTFYTRTGDAFAYLSVVTTLLLLGASRRSYTMSV